MLCQPILLVCTFFLLCFFPFFSASEEDETGDDANEISHLRKYLENDYSSIGAGGLYRRRKQPSYKDIIPLTEERVHYFNSPSINFRRSLMSYPPHYINALVRKRLESNTRSIKNPTVLSLRSRKPSFVPARQKSAIEQANDAERHRTLLIRDYIASMNNVLRENAIRLQNQIFLRDAMVKAMMHPPSGLYKKILQNPIQTEEETLHSAFAYMLGNKQNPYVQRYERMKLERLLRHNQEGMANEASNQPVTASRRFVAPSYAKLQQAQQNYQRMQQNWQRAFYLARNRALKAQQREVMKQNPKTALKSSLVPYDLPKSVSKVNHAPVGNRLMQKGSKNTATTTAIIGPSSKMNEFSKTSGESQRLENKGSTLDKAVLINRINTANLISSALNGLRAKLLSMKGGSIQQGMTTNYPNSAPAQNKNKASSNEMVSIPDKLKSKYKIKISEVPQSRSLASLDKIKEALRKSSDLKPLKVPFGSGDIRVELQKSQSGLFNCTKKAGQERDDVVSVDVHGISNTALSQENCSSSSDVLNKRTKMKPGKNDDKVQETAVTDSSKSPHILFSNLPNIGSMKPITNTTLPKEVLKASSKKFEKDRKTKSHRGDGALEKEGTQETNNTSTQQSSGIKFDATPVQEKQDHRTKPIIHLKQQRNYALTPVSAQIGEKGQNGLTSDSGVSKGADNKTVGEQRKKTKNVATSGKGEVRAANPIVDEEVPTAKLYKQFVSNSEIDDSGDPMVDAFNPRASALLYQRKSRAKKILTKRAHISARPTFDTFRGEKQSNKNDLDRSTNSNEEVSGHEMSGQEMTSGSGMPMEESETLPTQLMFSKDTDSSTKLDHRHHVKWHFFRHLSHKNYHYI